MNIGSFNKPIAEMNETELTIVVATMNAKLSFLLLASSLEERKKLASSIRKFLEELFECLKNDQSKETLDEVLADLEQMEESEFKEIRMMHASHMGRLINGHISQIIGEPEA